MRSMLALQPVGRSPRRTARSPGAGKPPPTPHSRPARPSPRTGGPPSPWSPPCRRPPRRRPVQPLLGDVDELLLLEIRQVGHRDLVDGLGEEQHLE